MKSNCDDALRLTNYLKPNRFRPALIRLAIPKNRTNPLDGMKLQLYSYGSNKPRRRISPDQGIGRRIGSAEIWSLLADASRSPGEGRIRGGGEVGKLIQYGWSGGQNYIEKQLTSSELLRVPAILSAKNNTRTVFDCWIYSRRQSVYLFRGIQSISI